MRRTCNGVSLVICELVDQLLMIASRELMTVNAILPSYGYDKDVGYMRTFEKGFSCWGEKWQLTRRRLNADAPNR